MEAGLSRRAAGQALALHPKSIEAYESGRLSPDAAVVLAMAKLYGKACLNQQYCRRQCAIGAAYSYEYLNNVDRTPQNILLKLCQAHRDAGEAIGRMLVTIVNKRQADDFSEREKQSFEQGLHELLDLEHTIETLKMELGERQWCDIPQLVSEHNSKCYRQGYVTHDVVKEDACIYCAFGATG
jgi:transcriptional regulator with XRE-family HTH domain